MTLEESDSSIVWLARGGGGQVKVFAIVLGILSASVLGLRRPLFTCLAVPYIWVAIII